jgi:thiosulfate/3-mercaptopyruvate sulfurtransferase
MYIAMSSSSTVPNIVSTEWVAQNHESIIPLDGSWHMPNANRDPYKEYLEKRIKVANE